MKLVDLIGPGAPVTIRDDDDVGLAAQVMLWGEVRHLPVIRDGDLVGIISERDLLAHQVRRGPHGREDPVATMMTKPVIVGSPEMELADAAELVVERQLGCLPVLRGRKLVGIVTRTDLVRQLRPAAAPRATGSRTAGDIMTHDTATASADDPLLDAMPRMESRGVRHLPVSTASEPSSGCSAIGTCAPPSDTRCDRCGRRTRSSGSRRPGCGRPR